MHWEKWEDYTIEMKFLVLGEFIFKGILKWQMKIVLVNELLIKFYKWSIKLVYID